MTYTILNLTDSHIDQPVYDMEGKCDGPSEIAVSFDGEWHIKGHNSTVDVCFVIDVVTGFALDYIVLSKYCAECELVRNKLDGEQKELWLEAHTSVCDRNHFGSSGAMEIEGAKVFWAMSEQVVNSQYT